MYNPAFNYKPLFPQAFRVCTDENGVVFVTFSDDFKGRLEETFTYLGYIAHDENSHIAYLRSKLLALIGPWESEYLFDLASGRRGKGVVVFDNLPFEPIIWSPALGMPPHSAKATSLSEHLLLAISTFFGEAYGVAKEGNRLVNDLIPSKEDLDKLTGNGSRMPLGLHTENAALRFAKPGFDWSPKGLLLGEVSEQKVGRPKTMVSIASKACALLPNQAVTILRRPCSRLGLPIRQRTGETKKSAIGPVPIILGADGKEEVIAAFYGDMMRPINAKALWAVGLLNEKLDEVAFGIPIVPGRIVYLANGRVLHGRSDFNPIFDENGRAQRWIQRVFVCARLDAFNGCRALTDRVFDVML
ncbi:Fe(II)-2OG oxygenase family protein [Methylovulum psychrotolerans]|uniref:TauD/TfdA-like domain-containing protein n=1 Tax=Methylovulum psychrotolerans TaxID=1704499 RepID=A0A1Z4C4Q3_9GAMM|nr:hypothetical protein [Methylovulum psychrotolerans]ASF48485.1 hypothetical protein CEK71_21840 [Methylovulum psychrotolerans]